MPTYAYRCTECGHAFDVYQSFTDAPLTECPECRGVVRKVLSPVGVVFKGSGFYRTDSRSGGSSGTGKSESSTTKKSDGGSGDTSSSSSSSSKDSASPKASSTGGDSTKASTSSAASTS